jgi:hypothetical protein
MKVLFGAFALTMPIMMSQAIFAADDRARIIEQFVCKDVVRDGGADRDVAIAFLQGFLLGKSGSSKFDVQVLQKESHAFIERCLDNPSERAIDAMVKVKS